MRIDSVEFVCSAADVADCPRRPIVEIAVSGRSNVGKSSLLNTLLGRKGLARVSSTPGKTQLLLYMLVNQAFHLVDLPGYGYARAPESERQRWHRMMQRYFRLRKNLCGVVQLLDVRHAPSDQDREMIDWLRRESLAFCLVPTKMDKLSRGERSVRLADLLRDLQLPGDQPVVPFSSKTGEGRTELLDWIMRAVQQASRRVADS